MKPSMQGWKFECSGRDIYCNRGIIGFDPRTGEVTEGYDGELPVFWNTAEQCYQLTDAEAEELADHMIAQWQDWKDRKRWRRLQ